MLFARQKLLLSLLDKLGGEAGNKDYQKLLFLYCQEVEQPPAYEFVPYKYGGFSFTSYADRRKLETCGLLVKDTEVWKLTPAGHTSAVVDARTRSRIGLFVMRHTLRGDALVAEAYRRHPYYAIRSTIANRVLAGDTATLLAIAAAKPTACGAGLCTIGYEGHSLESYLNRLLQNGVTLLCDVRRNPLSRKYGFSKKTLTKSATGVGIQYAHLPELGIASEARRELTTQSDYDALFTEYERTTLPRQTEALQKIRGWIDARQRVALTCYEKLPQQCHRHCIAEALERTEGNTLSAAHL